MEISLQSHSYVPCFYLRFETFLCDSSCRVVTALLLCCGDFSTSVACAMELCHLSMKEGSLFCFVLFVPICFGGIGMCLWCCWQDLDEQDLIEFIW